MTFTVIKDIIALIFVSFVLICLFLSQSEVGHLAVAGAAKVGAQSIVIITIKVED